MSDSDSDIEYHGENSFDSDEFNNLMRHGPGYDNSEDENDNENAFGTTDYEPGYLGIGYDLAEENDGFGFFLDDYVDGKMVIEGELCEKCENVDCACGYKFNSDKIIAGEDLLMKSANTDNDEHADELIEKKNDKQIDDLFNV